MEKKLKVFKDRNDGLHEFKDIEQREYGTKGRKAWYLQVLCGNCGETSWMRSDVAIKSEKCDHCSRKLKNLKHGLRDKRIYHVYAEMLARCNTPSHRKYYRYGARGIKIEFLDVVDFYNWSKKNGYIEEQSGEYKEYQAIDRIDNDGNYSKTNCQWITVSENSKKKLGAYNV